MTFAESWAKLKLHNFSSLKRKLNRSLIKFVVIVQLFNVVPKAHAFSSKVTEISDQIVRMVNSDEFKKKPHDFQVQAYGTLMDRYINQMKKEIEVALATGDYVRLAKDLDIVEDLGIKLGDRELKKYAKDMKKEVEDLLKEKRMEHEKRGKGYLKEYDEIKAIATKITVGVFEYAGRKFVTATASLPRRSAARNKADLLMEKYAQDNNLTIKSGQMNTQSTQMSKDGSMYITTVWKEVER